MDVLGESSDTIMEKFLGEEEISPAEIRAALREATINHGVVPVLNGTAFKNKGVQPLLDAICWYMPSPAELPPVVGTEQEGRGDRAQALGQGAVLGAGVQDHDRPPRRQAHLLPGVLRHAREGRHRPTTAAGNKERIGRVLEMHANEQIEQDAVYAGDIVAGIGLKDTRTGDTLSDPPTRSCSSRSSSPSR
jgi:elongation factor G